MENFNLNKMWDSLKNMNEEELGLLIDTANSIRRQKNTAARIAAAGKVLAAINEYVDTFNESDFCIKEVPLINEWGDTIYEDISFSAIDLFVNEDGYLEVGRS